MLIIWACLHWSGEEATDTQKPQSCPLPGIYQMTAATGGCVYRLDVGCRNSSVIHVGSAAVCSSTHSAAFNARCEWLVSFRSAIIEWLMACSHRRRGQNCLVLSAVVFTPPTRQDKTVLSRLQYCVHTANVDSSKLGRYSSKLGRDETQLFWRCEHNWRPDKTVLSRRVGGVNKPLRGVLTK